MLRPAHRDLLIRVRLRGGYFRHKRRPVFYRPHGGGIEVCGSSTEAAICRASSTYVENTRRFGRGVAPAQGAMVATESFPRECQSRGICKSRCMMPWRTTLALGYGDEIVARSGKGTPSERKIVPPA